MGRIEIDTDQLATIAGRQAAIAAHVAELRGELDAAAAGAAGAAGDGGVSGAVGDYGQAWSSALSGLSAAVHGYAANAGAAAQAYRQTDASAMPAGG
jgi:hypothetical protein